MFILDGVRNWWYRRFRLPVIEAQDKRYHEGIDAGIKWGLESALTGQAVNAYMHWPLEGVDRQLAVARLREVANAIERGNPTLEAVRREMDRSAAQAGKETDNA